MSRKFGGLVQLGLYSVAALSLVTIALDDARADWTPTKGPVPASFLTAVGR